MPRPFGNSAISMVVLAIFVATAGCAQSPGKRTMASAPDDEPYRFESEGQVPPPTPGSMRKQVDRVDVFEETPVAEGAIVFESVVDEVPMTQGDDSTMTGPGYRVQVFASGTRETAETFEMQIEIQMGVDTYLEYIDGMFKVRVGDCRSRTQAEELLHKCRKAGFEDAWIVSTEVRWRRPSREGVAAEGQ